MSTTSATTPALYDSGGRPLGARGLAFTAEQAVAVTGRDGPMLLAANAGSGKTAVLAERFVRSVVEDGHPPATLLAITFTEKAAGELRARIRRRFLELGARDGARDMDGAWISTIHGFCARILRAHAVTAGLDPAFVVLDEAVARQARSEAFTTALAAFLPAGGAGPELDLVATWGVDRLHEAIASVHDELRSTGHTVPSLPPAPPVPDEAALLADVRAALAALNAERATWRTGLKTLDAAHLVLEGLGEALATLTGGPLAAHLAGVRLKRQAAELKTDAAAALAAAIDACLQARVDAEAVAALGHLDRLLGLYAGAYAKAKRARSAVDYDDLELLTKDLLTGAPAVAAAYRERFARIMVDEFQDTNPLQLELLEQLDAGNVFLVGDALQSIYGFRHADVGVFRRRRREHAEIGAAPTLATNWRSAPPLLETINAAFGALHEDYVPLVPGRADAGEEDAGAGPSRVELLLVDDGHDDEARLAPEAAAALQAGMPQARNLTLLAEARAVAARVAALVAAGECGAGDVALLVRAAGDLHVYERALELEGLATLASGGRGYWLRQQVQDLTSYLAALANPLDEPALLGVLASPLVGLSSDGLAALAQTSRGHGRGLWATLTHGLATAGLGPRDHAAATAFLEWFAAERAQAPLLALDRLITRVVARTGYDLHVLRLSGGRRRLANIHKLERLAADFEARAGRDARAFIDHVAAEVAAQAREPEAPVELGDLDAVQLMTIHAAKGLEFGVVVVAGLGRPGQAGAADILVDGPRVGLRLRRLHAPNADALDYAALKAEVLEAQVQEERRIMHVAFTRAEERLIISGAVTLGKDLPKERAGGPPLGWVGACVDEQLPYRLTPEAPELVVDRHAGPDRLTVTARLVAPEGGAAGDAPSPPAAPAPAPAPPPVPPAPPVPSTPPAASPAAPAPAPAADEQQLTFAVGETAPTAPAPRRRRTARAGVPAPAAPLAAVAGAPAAAPPPATLSATSLRDHADCGYRYYLRRVLGLPDQEPPAELAAEATDAATAPVALDPLVRGTIAHALLEVDDPGAVTPDDVREAALDAGAEVSGADVEDLLRLVRAFGATGTAARVAGAVRVRREEPFAFALDDRDPASPLVGGFIDLVAVLEDGTWLVVDYKTGYAAADVEHVVAHTYATQRRIYALAAFRGGAPRVEVAYVFLEQPEAPVLATYTDPVVLTDELLAEAAPLLAGRFPVAAHPHRDLCLSCPGRGAMCSWPEAMTLRPAPAAG
ncbi:UvrD-helicase domain-containing protein [Paraconexibacter antarcticus]|uniref:DNA 3'-5' helicase n=1 Tax=Paraconexibacter antarcticus TaxID=2949664 RepID=A0ABY5DX25_9ACTN|nr:UvrD-helicase domain-containing protein [Paraconexibacter antarcticus]UTI66578.1 UvrD-helicase domain-containing protein [Paraconexibacter antarcticus]